MNLKNKKALITGGARMGEAIGLSLAQAGCDVALTYHHSQGPILAAAQKIQAQGVETQTLSADLANEKDLPTLVQSLENSWKGVDILINMASLYDKTPWTQLEASPQGSVEAWDKNMDIHLRSAYQLALLLAPGMRRRGGGRVVNFIDWVVASGRPRYHHYLPYYVSKAGLKGLTESLALELAPAILVNAVAPGPILPPAGLDEEHNTEVLRSTPLGKWGGAEEIAKAVLFLVSTDFVTGECLRVDGGRHLY